MADNFRLRIKRGRWLANRSSGGAIRVRRRGVAAMADNLRLNQKEDVGLPTVALEGIRGLGDVRRRWQVSPLWRTTSA